MVAFKDARNVRIRRQTGHLVSQLQTTALVSIHRDLQDICMAFRIRERSEGSLISRQTSKHVDKMMKSMRAVARRAAVRLQRISTLERAKTYSHFDALQ